MTIIMNGGDSLKDCPKNWEEAKIIQEKLNAGKEEYGPQWKFDCGFKLDYDGGLVQVSSRFYPPKTHYGSVWDGIVQVFLMDKKVGEKKFFCDTLDELSKQVEEYILSIKLRIESIF